MNSDTNDLPPASKQRVSKFPIITIVIVAVLLVGGMVAAFFIFRPVTPEQHLSRALENSLTTATVVQVWTMKSEGFSHQATAKTDYSNPAQSRAEVAFRKIDQATTVDYSVISLGKDASYMKFAKYNVDGIPEVENLEKSLQGRWFNTKDNAALGTTPIDSINTPLGQIITGNFSQELRSDILKQINDGTIYSIKKSSNVVENGQTLLRLAVAIDTDKIIALNNMVAEKLHIDPVDLSGVSKESHVLFIDAATNRIVRLETTVDGQTTTLSYSNFNEPLDIKKPTNLISNEDLQKITEAAGL